MTEYKKDYFEDRKLKYEKNHGNFIHEFMFTEFSNRILGQCNIALNDLQRQLDEEIARATAEEKRLDGKIDIETNRAKAEEVRLDAKIDSETSRATEIEKNLLENQTNLREDLNKVLSPETDLNKIREDINNETIRAKREESNLNQKIDEEISRAQGFEYNLDTKITTVYSDIQDNVNPDLNNIKNNINKVLKYSNLYYSNDYDINEIDDNLKINYSEIQLNDGKYVTAINDGRALKDILNSTFAIVATALNDIKTKLDALENK